MKTSDEIKARDREYSRAYRAANPERSRKAASDYYQRNKEKVRKRKAKYAKTRRTVDFEFKISSNLRTRMYVAIKNDQKSGSAVRDLGCSVSYLKDWLELSWAKGMSWTNYGRVWHIDHIKPLALFDLTDRKQYLEAANYTNLQPLFALDNIRKGDKYDNC